MWQTLIFLVPFLVLIPSLGSCHCSMPPPVSQGRGGFYCSGLNFLTGQMHPLFPSVLSSLLLFSSSLLPPPLFLLPHLLPLPHLYSLSSCHAVFVFLLLLPFHLPFLSLSFLFTFSPFSLTFISVPQYMPCSISLLDLHCYIYDKFKS